MLACKRKLIREVQAYTPKKLKSGLGPEKEIHYSRKQNLLVLVVKAKDFTEKE